jgi:uncharacterized membrane protein YfcA
MIDSKNVIYRLAAVLLIIIGLAAIVSAWDLLLLAHVYSKTVLAIELGGVIVCLIGYFLWKRTGMAKKDLAGQEDTKAIKEP